MSTQAKFSTTRSVTLDSAIATALVVVPADHIAMETLGLDELSSLAWGQGANLAALEPLRVYLDNLPGFMIARVNGVEFPAFAKDVHTYTVMLVFSKKTNSAVGCAAGTGVVVASVLPALSVALGNCEFN